MCGIQREADFLFFFFNLESWILTCRLGSSGEHWERIFQKPNENKSKRDFPSYVLKSTQTSLQFHIKAECGKGLLISNHPRYIYVRTYVRATANVSWICSSECNTRWHFKYTDVVLSNYFLLYVRGWRKSCWVLMWYWNIIFICFLASRCIPHIRGKAEIIWEPYFKTLRFH